MVKVNGENRDFAGKTITEIISALNYGEIHVAVELNEEIVSRSLHSETRVKDGDVVEIVRFVGGG